MVTNFYDKVVVKIKYEDFVGSGVMISDVSNINLFLISAWHCFGKQSEIDYQEIEIFRQENSVLKEITVRFKDKIIIEEKDIVIFEIDSLEDVPRYQIVCPEEEKVAFVGFPNGLSGEECGNSRYTMRGEVNEVRGDSSIQVNGNRFFETYCRDAKSNMSGYSGCGLFVENEDTPRLCGIVTKLGSPEGLFSFVYGVSILVIDEAIYKKCGTHLSNIKICSFKEYEQSTLEIFEDSLASVCAVQMPNILENVAPNNILEHCGNKIVWPYSNKSILKKEVWEEWLLYLVIRSIENHENMKNGDFYVIKTNGKVRKVKVLYATNHTVLTSFLKDYLENAYQDVSTDQIMIINTKKTPASKRISSKRIGEIVSDISTVIEKNNHIYIDTVESDMGQISLIHIAELIEEMNNFVNQEENENLRGKKLEEKLSKRITEVLYGL